MEVLAAAPIVVPSLLSAEGAFLACTVGVVIDKMGVGGPKIAFITDRLAFLCWVSVWAVGFDQTGISGQINGIISGLFTWIGTLYDAPLFRGGANIAPTIIGVVVAAIVLGAMLPNKLSRWLGRFVTIQFSQFKQAPAGGTMPATGTTRTGATAAGGGRGIIGKIFSGQMNWGLVAVALLFVTAGQAVGGGAGQLIDAGVDICIGATAWWANPLLAWVGSA